MMPRKTCKFRLSRNSTKFYVLARFRERIPTVQSVSSSEIHRINYGFLTEIIIFVTEITILSFFHKLEFLGSYMDAFSGYNQISMDPNDQENTSFVTVQGTYCYRVMPFGLKNVGATYHRLVNRMFQKQIGTTMEVYIDDMLVKSTTAELHIAHLSEAFQILKNYNMKLNPAKCAFGVSDGKFLGFIVNHRGMEANPDKIKVVLDMPSPSGIKEVQRLTGRITALSRFVSRASDKCQPFFQVLKKAFQWDVKCEKHSQH